MKKLTPLLLCLLIAVASAENIDSTSSSRSYIVIGYPAGFKGLCKDYTDDMGYRLSSFPPALFGLKGTIDLPYSTGLALGYDVTLGPDIETDLVEAGARLHEIKLSPFYNLLNKNLRLEAGVGMVYAIYRYKLEEDKYTKEFLLNYSLYAGTMKYGIEFDYNKVNWYVSVVFDLF